MTGKTEKQFFFEVQLNWLEATRGILSSKEADGTLYVATPAKFGGEGKPWTPEHLFLSAISSSFMTTYLAFVRKLKFGISHLDCNAIGQIELVDGRYQFTNINLFPKIYIAEESIREKASLALEKTHKYCLISNSIGAKLFYHSEILQDPHPRNAVPVQAKPKTIFSLAGAKEIGDRLGIDFKRYRLMEFKKGLEMEQGKQKADATITDDADFTAAKIAWGRLQEIPDYYTRLDKMEKEARKQLLENVK
jgi:organic hydroperoxide reductase OsmC/OhrA